MDNSCNEGNGLIEVDPNSSPLDVRDALTC